MTSLRGSRTLDVSGRGRVASHTRSPLPEPTALQSSRHSAADMPPAMLAVWESRHSPPYSPTTASPNCGSSPGVVVLQRLLPACMPSTLQCLALPSRFLYNSITWGAPPHVAQILPPRIPTQIGLLPRTLFDYICSAPPRCEFTLPTVDSVAVGLQCTLPDAYPELTMPRHRSRPNLQRETAPK
jgi:hypothetical protein